MEQGELDSSFRGEAALTAFIRGIETALRSPAVRKEKTGAELGPKEGQ